MKQKRKLENNKKKTKVVEGQANEKQNKTKTDG